MKPIIICLDGVTLYDVTLATVVGAVNQKYLYTSILKNFSEIARFNGNTHTLKYDNELSKAVTEKVYYLKRR